MNSSHIDIAVPDYIKTVIGSLNAAGFEAWAVGGCVRDSLLGMTPNDWDVTTSALPEETKRVFADRHTIDTGIKHGTVTVRIDGNSVEVTTYRADGEYTDHRHPESVEFSRNLLSDLSRRDFTVNAMCYCPEKGITDVFGGREDLERKVIRCVGDPMKRFDEDALRILRALRFAATLGFSIEKETAEAIEKSNVYLGSISVERIYAELTKMLKKLVSPGIPIAFRSTIETVLPQIKKISDADFEKACTLASQTDDTIISWALFLSPLCEEDIRSVFESLKSDRKTRDTVLFLCANKNTALTGKGDILRLIGEYDIEYLKGLWGFRKLCGGGSEDELFREAFAMYESGCPVRTADLAVNGNDIAALGFRGAGIGNISRRLLHAVMYEGLENSKDVLLEYAAAFSD